jgi:hypothetical protein
MEIIAFKKEKKIPLILKWICFFLFSVQTENLNKFLFSKTQTHTHTHKKMKLFFVSVGNLLGIENVFKRLMKNFIVFILQL